jgi:hypothetical protein
MIALIGCEESQTVCKEFRERGHLAFSCDFKPCSGGHPEWHLQMDVLEAISLRRWDFIGLHPDCTKMTLSGNRHYAPGKPKHQERLDAVEWTINLWKLAILCGYSVYMENPMGAMNGDSRLPTPQIIQPYYFGDPFQKTTCLWLKNLSPLYHNATPNLFDKKITHVDKGITHVHASGKTMNDFHYQTSLLPQKERSEARSKTFPGIAKAMAEQWG